MRKRYVGLWARRGPPASGIEREREIRGRNPQHRTLVIRVLSMMCLIEWGGVHSGLGVRK